MKDPIKIIGYNEKTDVTKGQSHTGREVFIDGEVGAIGETVELPEFRVIYETQPDYFKLSDKYDE